MIHIACTADQRLMPDCGVMLHSLFTSNPDEVFEVHFLHDDQLPVADLEGLAQIARAFGVAFTPQLVTREMAIDFPLTERFGLNAWYRILLPDLLPDVNKLLYLDADLLILKSVRELWDTDLGGRLLAAVTQPIPEDMLPRIRDTLGLPDRDSYFNTGVMLLDLDVIRHRRCAEKVVAFIRDRRAPMPWADQDPMNAVLHAERLSLHPRWNLMTPMIETPDHLPPFTVEDLHAAIADPAVIHFIGEYKPLHYRCRHPYRAHFFTHLRQTPWKERQIHGRSLRHMLLRLLPWVLQHRVEKLLRNIRVQLSSAVQFLRWH